MRRRTFSIGIVTFDGVKRVEALLKTLKKFAPVAWDTSLIKKIVVCEDPLPEWVIPQPTIAYQKLCNAYKVEFYKRDSWGCMQGNANFLMEKCDTDVVFILSDDILFSGDCITPMIYFWEKNPELKIGAVQFPFWFAEQLINLKILDTKDDFYGIFLEKLLKEEIKIPRKAVWEYTGYSRIYHSVHGTGFALDRNLYFKLGRFSEGHWSYDEDISAKIWINSDYFVCTLLGPPLLHYGGASQCSRYYKKFLDPAEDFKNSWGKSKTEVGQEVYRAMARKSYVNDLLKKANYYDS